MGGASPALEVTCRRSVVVDGMGACASVGDVDEGAGADADAGTVHVDNTEVSKLIIGKTEKTKKAVPAESKDMVSVANDGDEGRL